MLCLGCTGNNAEKMNGLERAEGGRALPSDLCFCNARHFQSKILSFFAVARWVMS